MRQWWVRVSMFMLVASGAVVIFALLIGYYTASLTGDLPHKGVRYALRIQMSSEASEGATHSQLIRDVQRGLQVELTGTRCFESLPLWIAELHDEQSNSYYGQLVKAHDEQRQDAGQTLRCRPLSLSSPYGLSNP